MQPTESVRHPILTVAVALFVGLVVLTILIPSNLCRGSGAAAPESNAVATIRTINTAEVTYLSVSGGNYGNLAALVSAGLLDSTFAESPARKGGYFYWVSWSAAAPRVYTAYAEPVSKETGRYGYYSLPDAVVRFSTNAATSNGKPGAPVN
jgi:hypothetical protein